jgi:hypothetical protein
MPDDPESEKKPLSGAEMEAALDAIESQPPLWRKSIESLISTPKKEDPQTNLVPSQFPNSPSLLGKRLRRICTNAVAEAFNTLLFMLLLAGAGWLVEHLFGERKLFDYVPVRYLFDVGDVAVIGRFIWNTLRGEE